MAYSTFSIEFVNPDINPYVVPAINFGCTVIATSAIEILLGNISHLALKTLGFEQMASTAAQMTSVVVNVTGYVGIFGLCCLCVTLVKKQCNDLRAAALSVE